MAAPAMAPSPVRVPQRGQYWRQVLAKVPLYRKLPWYLCKPSERMPCIVDDGLDRGTIYGPVHDVDVEEFSEYGLTLMAVQVPIPRRMYPGARPDGLEGIHLIWINVYSSKHGWYCRTIEIAEVERWKKRGWEDTYLDESPNCKRRALQHACPPSSSTRLRFQVIHSVTGAFLELPHVSTRIYDNTTLEWLLPYVARSLSWPISHVRLTAGGTTVKYILRIAHRTMTRIVDLNLSETSEARPFVIQATLLPPPEDFLPADAEADDARLIRGLCLCDFRGCCRLCKKPGLPRRCVCSGCGNNGCCRSRNCGHTCCGEGIAERDLRSRCPFQECAPG